MELDVCSVVGGIGLDGLLYLAQKVSWLCFVPFQVLDLPYDATLTEIKQKYRRVSCTNICTNV